MAINTSITGRSREKLGWGYSIRRLPLIASFTEL